MQELKRENSDMKQYVLALQGEVYGTRLAVHISLLLRQLHWLRVPERIRFRLGVVAFRCLHGTTTPQLGGSLSHAADVDGRHHLLD